MGAEKKKRVALSKEERAAMRDRIEELKGNDGEDAVLAKIAAMKAPDRAMAERLHQLVREVAPQLTPRLWYGMPAWAKEGKVLCFFQDANRFKSRYATFGFSDKANLDEGNFWPTGFALRSLGRAEEARIAALVKRAAT